MQALASLPLIVLLTGCGALAMLVPAAHALALGDELVARAFAQSALLFLLAAALVAITLRGWRPRNAARNQLSSYVAGFVALPLMLAVPFREAVPDTTYFNAWFEMVSSFTTTGATVYDTPGRLAPSLHLWRVLVGWLGGLMVLIAAAAILAPMDLGGAEVISGRVPGQGMGVPGVTRADAATRLARHAGAILPAYLGLTLALWVALLLSGVDSFAALCLALSTLATSAVLPDTGLSELQVGFVAEVLIFAFLCLGLTRRSLPGTALVDRRLPLARDPELRTAAAILIAVPALLFLRHWTAAAGIAEDRDLMAALRALWGALFTTLSFLTTAGYESAEWQAARAWSGLRTPGLVLLGLAMIGGGIATVTGGLKLLRVYALYRHTEAELRHFVHEHAVPGGGETERRLRGEGAFAAFVFFMLFSLSLAVLIGVLALAGLAFDDALVLAVTALSTTGPLATLAADAPLRFADLSEPVRSALAAGMIIGRLEILAILTLLAPSAWRR